MEPVSASELRKNTDTIGLQAIKLHADIQYQRWLSAGYTLVVRLSKESAYKQVYLKVDTLPAGYRGKAIADLTRLFPGTRVFNSQYTTRDGHHVVRSPCIMISWYPPPPSFLDWIRSRF